MKSTNSEKKQRVSTSVEQSQDTILKELASTCNTDKATIIRHILGLYIDKVTGESGQILPSVKGEIENQLNGLIIEPNDSDSLIPRIERLNTLSTPLSANGLYSLQMALFHFQQEINQFEWMSDMVDILKVYVKNSDHNEPQTNLRIRILSDTMELFRMLGEVVAIDDVEKWEEYPELIES